jgi:hypothetical protein
MLKVGDIVICLSNSMDILRAIGLVGTVERVDAIDEFPYLVRFDKSLSLWCSAAPLTPLLKALL